MPNPLRETLHEGIREFLAAVTFETPDRIKLTDEIKTLIAAHACLLLQGNIGGFNGLKTIHVHRRKFRLHNNYWDFISKTMRGIWHGIKWRRGWRVPPAGTRCYFGSYKYCTERSVGAVVSQLLSNG